MKEEQYLKKIYGELSWIAMTLTFILFSLIGSCRNLSDINDSIKQEQQKKHFDPKGVLMTFSCPAWIY